jgi:hypothetical protein
VRIQETMLLKYSTTSFLEYQVLVEFFYGIGCHPEEDVLVFWEELVLTGLISSISPQGSFI